MSLSEVKVFALCLVFKRDLHVPVLEVLLNWIKGSRILFEKENNSVEFNFNEIVLSTDLTKLQLDNIL